MVNGLEDESSFADFPAFALFVAPSSGAVSYNKPNNYEYFILEENCRGCAIVMTRMIPMDRQIGHKRRQP